MFKKTKTKAFLSLLAAAMMVLAACSSQTTTPQSSTANEPEVSSSAPATPEVEGTSQAAETPEAGADSDEPLYIYLTRHGQTVTNVTNRLVSEFASSSLTEPGKEVAYYLGLGLADVKFRSAYCTSKSRTFETASIILNQSQTSKGLDIVPIHDMREFNAGFYESTTFAEMMENYKFELSDEEFEQKFLLDQFLQNDSTGEAEGWDKFAERVIASFKAMCEEEAAKGGGNVLVVAHGGVNRLLGEQLSGERQPGAKNSSIVLIEYKGGEYKVLSYNDTSFIEKGKAMVENPQPVTVNLVAHGETRLDKLDWLYSALDPDITEAGIAQMEAVGKKLADKDLAGVYSSDLFTDMDSAKAIISQSKNPNLMVNTDTGLRSACLGLAEGQRMEEAKVVTEKLTSHTAQAVIDAYFTADEAKIAEDYATAKTRIMAAFEEICKDTYAKGGGEIVIVSSGLTQQLITEALVSSGDAKVMNCGDVAVVQYDGTTYTVQ